MVVETYAVIQAGVDLETLDKAMKSFGFPVGPITLADEVGVDVANHVFSYLSKAGIVNNYHNN
jgi:enoyl-CoA hydratase/long-chain 3-hydroxyacyl-CoA dehydrogenase